MIGTMRGTHHGDNFFLIRSWHTLILVLTVVIGMALSYASTRDQTNQNTQDIQELKQRALTRDLYEASQEDIKQRLDRLEKKIDSIEDQHVQMLAKKK